MNTIYLSVPPTISVDGPSSPVVIGESFTLTCAASAGDEPIYYVWIRESDMGVVTIDSNYTVVSATMDDFGGYRCNATNSFGEDSATWTVVKAGM